MTKKTKEERILLYNNFSRKEEIERRLRNVASIANTTVIPICQALNMPLLTNQILEWVNDEDAFRSAFVKKCKRDAGQVGGFVSKLVVEAAESDFNTQLKFYPYPANRGTTMLLEDEARMMKLCRNTMTYDIKKLTEYTNVYLTDPKKIETYHKCEELCRILDEFFAGSIPKNDLLNSWASFVYPTDSGFKVNGRADFSKLTKKKEVPPAFSKNASREAVEGVTE